MMLKYVKKLGLLLSLDHHSQALLLGAALAFTITRAWWSLPGLVFYTIMQFRYGGAGTFQHPPSGDDRPPSLADFFYVAMGVTGILLMVAGVGLRVAEALG